MQALLHDGCWFPAPLPLSGLFAAKNLRRNHEEGPTQESVAKLSSVLPSPRKDR